MLLTTLVLPLVQADSGGVGKYLEVNIVGAGSVNALKEKSAQSWDFTYNRTEKVGAGTVILKANADPYWEFSHWIGDVDVISPNQATYKTTKYGVVTAVFVRSHYKITVTPWGDGTIKLDSVPVSGDVYVEAGATPTFEFCPDEGKHVSAVVTSIDGFLLFPVSSYTFPPVTADQWITVIFSAIGEAPVFFGTGQTVFPDPSVILGIPDVPEPETLLETVSNGGVAGTAYAAVGADPFDLFAFAWNITVTFTFTGEINVTIHYDPTTLPDGVTEESLSLIRADSIEAIRSDVTGDLVVDGEDVSYVANVVKQSIWYDPVCDLDNDLDNDEDDIHIVNANKGAELDDITAGRNTDLDLIWGYTDEFSFIFGR